MDHETGARRDDERIAYSCKFGAVVSPNPSEEADGDGEMDAQVVDVCPLRIHF